MNYPPIRFLTGMSSYCSMEQLRNRHFDFEQNWLLASNNESHKMALIRTHLEFRQVDTLQLTKFEAFCNKTIPMVDSKFMVRAFLSKLVKKSVI